MAKPGEPPACSERQANTALCSHLGVTLAGRCCLESQPFQSTRGKEQLLGATTLSCPLLPWLVLVLRGLFRSVTDGPDLYVQSVPEFTELPLAGERSAWDPGTASSPSSSCLSIAWKNPQATCLLSLKPRG